VSVLHDVDGQNTLVPWDGLAGDMTAWDPKG
jgi:hypothetical protein